MLATTIIYRSVYIYIFSNQRVLHRRCLTTVRAWHKGRSYKLELFMSHHIHRPVCRLNHHKHFFCSSKQKHPPARPSKAPANIITNTFMPGQTSSVVAAATHRFFFPPWYTKGNQSNSRSIKQLVALCCILSHVYTTINPIHQAMLLVVSWCVWLGLEYI